MRHQPGKGHEKWARSKRNKRLRSDHQSLLEEEFTLAIKAAFPDIPDPPCPIAISTQKNADYQFNGAMAIAGIISANDENGLFVNIIVGLLYIDQI